MKRRRKSASIRRTKRSESSFAALLRSLFPFLSATRETSSRASTAKAKHPKTVRKSHASKKIFSTQNLRRKESIARENLAGMKELFDVRTAEHKKIAALPSTQLLRKGGVLKKAALSAPSDGEFDASFAELLEGVNPTTESAVLSDQEAKTEDQVGRRGSIPAVTALPAQPAGKSVLKRFFLMEMPFSFGSKPLGKMTAVTAPKQRHEMPLDLSVEEIRQLKGPAVDDKAETERAPKTKKDKQERNKEAAVKPAKKASVADKEKNLKEEKSRAQEQKEMEAGAKRRRTALRAQEPSGLRQFFATIAHFGLSKEKTLFTQNLATMLNAGLPLIDAIKILQAETKSRGMKRIIQRILNAVENGSALWRAMEAQNLFSPHAISLIHIGEEAGNLAENMEYLSVQQEKDHALRQKVKMAMIYPAIVMTLMFIIVMGLGIFVLPNLIQVLFSLNVPLPFITRVVIAFTNAFSAHGKTAVPVILGSVLVITILAKFTPLKIVTQWIIFHIPGVGKLAKQATIARFGVILGGLLKAGVPLVEALRSLADVTPTASYKKFYFKLLDHVNLGDSFSKSFATIRGSKRLLPISVQQLVTTGEQSGSLADILLKVSDIYEKKANETAQKLPIILEPLILLFIGALVGTIALAIIVPIYSIVGTVGRG